MAEAGRRAVTERFTIDRMVASQIDSYRRALPAPLQPASAAGGVRRA